MIRAMMIPALFSPSPAFPPMRIEVLRHEISPYMHTSPADKGAAQAGGAYRNYHPAKIWGEG